MSCHASPIPRTASIIACACLGALCVSPAEGGEPEAEIWVGHQVVHGKREIAVLGEVSTRADSFVLARITRRGEVLEIRQRACHVTFAKAVGTTVSMADETIRRLPEAAFRFIRTGSTYVHAEPWVVAWGTDDVDGDGNPGATIAVDSPICDGSVYVASATTSVARGLLNNDELRGNIDVRVQQEILGASGFCLRMASKNTDEQQNGTFVYRRASAGTTCETLATQKWPVRAE